ncbi:hypothetical protein SAMN05421788_101304 [Filimonas lacunae]|uniref:Zinc-finger n=1 Tax=Filimonas lacunae TaxID=477680 RepID=A0A173MMJ0_9BACT|nr:hypothetical protein [Filimonas lacunae]BAV08852.1 hypothetical protein FLA_4899 [Filimonas lacunae]SIS62784.1 hypothetical protein SAMN05421788_101304 [Filimonas lacunae]
MQQYPVNNTIPSCQQATLLAMKKEEGKISRAEKWKLFFHLLYCHVCRRFIRQMRRMNTLSENMHQHLQQQPPFTLSASAKEKMQQQLNNLDN